MTKNQTENINRWISIKSNHDVQGKAGQAKVDPCEELIETDEALVHHNKRRDEIDERHGKTQNHPEPKEFLRKIKVIEHEE